MDMTMQSNLPGWLTPVAWTYLALAVLSTAVIAADIYLARRRHDSVASELVWITSGLYLGPFAIAVYLSHGRSEAVPTDTSTLADDTAVKPENAAVAVLPGGGASAVAHLIAVPIVAAAGWTIAGLSMWPMIIVIAILAIAMLAAYERIASGRRGTSGRRRGSSLGAAFLAALVTVAAFDVGMVGWMLLLHFNGAMPPVSESTFWFLMQVGVVVGLVTGYPAVKWLISRHQSAALA